MIFLLLTLQMAMAQDLSEIQLRSLSDVSSKTINLKEGPPKVFVLFQKDCQSCHQQVRDLKCLSNKANVFLVGLFSTESDLRKEYRSFKSDWPGFYGGKEFTQKFTIKEDLTPQIIVVKQNQPEVILGLTSCEKISKKVRKHNG